MNIFGLTITTKKKQLAHIAKHDEEVQELKNEIINLNDEFMDLREQFPFDLGQVVYDVALKNAQGKYTKTKPSFEHSTITEVTVDEKNYFKLVARFNRNDVFYFREDAEDYLKSICE
jgi:hypothetical protein